ncbi:hypothetical protein [Membranihabitans marinus]|uniref:hypothetical protein n=1 Tax=Membranihabitans marinus TaxID=1227546 RepID=UPI001F31BE53|nr:hypothetical protein [Membranihabitans marinus]
MRIASSVGLYGLVFWLIMGCGTSKMTFPISTVVPAAEVEVKVKKDDNDNYGIQLKAKYLASPQRLSPSKRTYVLWAKTAESGVKNIGQLTSEASRTVQFKTSIPYRPIQFFITAEDDATVQWPSYQELMRTNVF